VSTPQRESRIVLRRQLTVLSIIVLTATVLFLPIFIFGFPKGDDAVKHHRWAVQFIDAFKEGTLYPRWLAEANRGYGSPAMLYYAPLPFYVVAACSLLTSSALQAITLSCWLATVLGGLAMYLASREVASHQASLIAAVMYLSAPYHVLDLYQVNALSEFWCLVWIPLVLLGVHRVVVRRDAGSVAILGASYGAMLLSHVPAPFAMTMLLVIYVPVLTREWRSVASVGLGLALGAGLSAVFILPVLFERKYVTINQVLRIDYRDYFLFDRASEFVSSALFRPGQLEDAYLREANLSAAALVLLLGVCCLVFWTADHAGAGIPGAVRLRRALIALAIVSLWLTSRLSLPLWRNLSVMKYLQVPGRFLTIADPAIFLLGAMALVAVATSRRRLFYPVIFGVVVLANLALDGIIVAHVRYDPERIQAKASSLDVEEYRPIWWDRVCRPEFDQVPILVANGDAGIQNRSDAGTKQIYDVDASSEALLRLRTLYFPGWVARLDGRRIDIHPGNEGNIELTVPQGQHQLFVSFEDTAPRIAGKIVSAVFFALLVAMLYVSRRKVAHA
jgi:6-pyruvoyl-tetrahydropterin synthase-like protein